VADDGGAMMSALRDALEEYLALRRSLGFKLERQAATLRTFVTFADAEAVEHITTELALRWLRETSKAQPATKAAWLDIVRRFAIWHSASDPQTQVPPAGLLPRRYHRQRPYIYSNEEIKRLVRAASELPSQRGVRGITYATYFGLIAATGMRMSEAVALDGTDVDLLGGVITVRRTKFGKSRLVPLHGSTCDALAVYANQRDAILGAAVSPAFFVSERGTRITKWSARYNFARVSQQIGLRPPASEFRHGHGPRLHDLRHRFAVRVLIQWYRTGCDVEREIPKLAAYLGHVHVNDTYWYIEAVPELLQLATERVIKTREARS
jgi:integrase